MLTGRKLMETQDISQEERSYEPTSDQAERAAELRRFNMLFVYGPIGLLSAIVLGVIVVLLVIAISQTSAEALIFISGLADVAMVIAMLPILIVGAVLLSLIGYGYYRGRQRGMAPVRQTQRLLWRMDHVVGRLRVRTGMTADSIIRPFLLLNGAFTYVKVLLQQSVKLIKRG
jgi:uncharacterized integral membrane protein